MGDDSPPPQADRSNGDEREWQRSYLYIVNGAAMRTRKGTTYCLTSLSCTVSAKLSPFGPTNDVHPTYVMLNAATTMLV